MTTKILGEALVQIEGEVRLVQDCNENVSPAALVGHFKITFDPEDWMVSGGGVGKVILNTVPEPELPP